MIALPAIDLREGACVQLVGGRYEDERVRRGDPLEVAREFRDAGFGTLHIVDLDAATGRGSNAAVIRELLALPGLTFQVGGGVRDTAAVTALLDAGAARVITGTRAIADRDWLTEMAYAYPDRIVVAADVRERRITTKGWSATDGPDIADGLLEMATLPLGGVLVTAVHREGALQGTDMPLMRELAGLTQLKLQASGGITHTDELRELATAGCSAAILGMALYTGALDARAVAEEFKA